MSDVVEVQMGLFDQVSGSLKGVLGSVAAAEAPALITAALAKTNMGNLQGIVDQLQQGGLGDQVKSWLVTQPKSTLRTVKQPKGTSKVVGPAGVGSKVVSPTITPRVITPRGTRTVTASRLRGVPVRGAGRAVIAGHNYSVWRGRHRVRHGGGWWTFGALSALGVIIIGSDQYYPYAYISAPENYCEGLTEDGCELVWQDVETIEGDVIPQCVAYCPWQ
jgi:hypothetical protein